jgi:signal transduction histidine kinase
MIAMGVMVGVRLFALRREPVDVAPSAAALRRSARRFVLGSLWAGLLWGATAVLFYWHGALEQQFLLVVALTGMGAGAVTSLIMYMPAFYAYVLPSLLPLAVVSLLLGDLPHAALGIATLVYAFALGYFGRNFSAALVESLALRYENLDLVEELRAQKRQADEANAAKSRFLAAASHDLRQPVHALALFSTTLAARRLEPGTRHLVSQIGAAVESLERMFDALLDISRLDAGVLRVRMEAFDLGTLVAELRAEFTPLAATKGLAFDAMEGACWVHADTALVERILRNLLSNAVRYTDSGTVRGSGCASRWRIPGAASRRTSTRRSSMSSTSSRTMLAATAVVSVSA